MHVRKAMRRKGRDGGPSARPARGARLRSPRPVSAAPGRSMRRPQARSTSAREAASARSTGRRRAPSRRRSSRPGCCRSIPAARNIALAGLGRSERPRQPGPRAPVLEEEHLRRDGRQADGRPGRRFGGNVARQLFKMEFILQALTYQADREDRLQSDANLNTQKAISDVAQHDRPGRRRDRQLSRRRRRAAARDGRRPSRHPRRNSCGSRPASRARTT